MSLSLPVMGTWELELGSGSESILMLCKLQTHQGEKVCALATPPVAAPRQLSALFNSSSRAANIFRPFKSDLSSQDSFIKYRVFFFTGPPPKK